MKTRNSSPRAAMAYRTGISAVLIGLIVLILFAVVEVEGGIAADNSGSSGEIPTYQLVIGGAGLITFIGGIILAWRARPTQKVRP